MSVLESDVKEVSHAAFALAWEGYAKCPALTPDEKAGGRAKLRDYIDMIVCTGERQPQKIARSALCLLREYDQIARSFARISCASIEG
jgi:hypothetical protein